tara:strand:+ start:1372 stop:2115 length:744 start_codon:yes stop_codon:yes gene_type:complete
MDIKFEWDGDMEKDIFISCKSLVNTNGGYFKSANQANYYQKDFGNTWNKCDDGPFEFLKKSQYEGCYYYSPTATLNAREWGSNSRRKGWTFIVDENGIVAMYQLGFEYGKGSERGWSGVDESKVKSLFTRKDSKSKIAVLEKGQKEIQNKIDGFNNAKINREYVGNAGDKKCEFEGVINFVTSYETPYGIQYITTFRNEDDNTIKYKGRHLGERNCKISLIANIKKHEIYKDEKQTIIERPRNIECK